MTWSGSGWGVIWDWAFFGLLSQISWPISLKFGQFFWLLAHVSQFLKTAGSSSSYPACSGQQLLHPFAHLVRIGSFLRALVVNYASYLFYNDPPWKLELNLKLAYLLTSFIFLFHDLNPVFSALDLSWTILLPWLRPHMYVMWESHSKESNNGEWVEIEQFHSVWAKGFRCSSTYVSYFLFRGVLCHFLTTLSTHSPFSLTDHSPCFDRLDRSGPLVSDQSSSIRLLRPKFTLLHSRTSFPPPPMNLCTAGPPSASHWRFWEVTVAFIFTATDYYVFEISYTQVGGDVKFCSLQTGGSKRHFTCFINVNTEKNECGRKRTTFLIKSCRFSIFIQIYNSLKCHLDD